MRDFWDDLAPIIIAGFVILVLTVGCFVWINHAEGVVDDKIEACINAGGQPVVAGHQFTTEFKGCVMP